MSVLLCAVLLTSTPAHSLAVLPPVPDASDTGWWGMAFADELTARLLSYGQFDPSVAARAEPPAVFGWRQTLSAARRAGLDTTTLLSTSHSERLLTHLGAGVVITGVYGVQTKAVTLIWRLTGVPAPQKHKTSIALDNLAAGVTEIAQQMLAAVGMSSRPLDPQAVVAVPAAALEPYGRALEIIEDQSLSPRAALVLSPVRVARAYQLMAAATGAEPTFARAWEGRAVLSAMMEEWEFGTMELDEAMAHEVTSSPTLALAAYYLNVRAGRLDEAIAALGAATTIHPGFMLGTGTLGETHVLANHNVAALATFATFQKRAPNNPWIAARRCEALARLGKNDLAVREMASLSRRFPDVPGIIAALAARQLDGDRIDDATATIQRALGAFPTDPEVLTRAAHVEIARGDYDAARQFADRAIAGAMQEPFQPLLGAAKLMQGHALALLGKTPDALAAFANAQAYGYDAYARSVVTGDTRLAKLIADPAFPLGTRSGPERRHRPDPIAAALTSAP